MKTILKKFVIIVVIICILISSLFSGFVMADEVVLTQERAGNYAANFAINFYDNWSSVSFVETGSKSNGSTDTVLGVAQEIWTKINGRTDLIYGHNENSSDRIVNHTDEITEIDCSSYVSAVLWALGYRAFATTNTTSDMSLRCSDGTYVGYGLKVFKNNNGKTQKWDGERFVDDSSLGDGVDFLQPGDIVVLNNGTRNHTNIVLDPEGNGYKALDCGDSSNWLNPYIYDNIWQNGAYVIRVGEKTGASSSKVKISSGTRVTKRGEIATRYDENAKVTDIDEGNKTTYVFNNETWINFVYKYSLGMGETNLTALLSHFDTEDEIFPTELVKTGDIIDITKLVNEGKIIPGDVLYVANGVSGGQYLLYVGGTKVLYATPTYADDPEKDNNKSAIRYMYLQHYLEGIKGDLIRGHEEEEGYKIPQFGVTKIYRLKQSYLDSNNITQDKANLRFNKKGYYTYDRYEGSPNETNSRLNATKQLNVFKWIFDGIVGIFEFIVNTILYALRMQILGWANVFELALQSILLGLSGDANSQMVSDFFGPDATSATGSRISIESILFNQIPILDANFFNFETAGGHELTTSEKVIYQPPTASGQGEYEVTKTTPKESNIIYQLRKNLRWWYALCRNASIAILLFVLIYLGIRYAITTVAELKADIKGYLVSWVTAILIVLFIHFFMYIVFEVNDYFVNTFKGMSENFASSALQNGNSEELTLYDAVRVKAYAFSFKEGVPSTIIYIFLIYLLVRFSYIYFKRYITVYILAITGSIMGLKYALEKMAGAKTTSLAKWFKDFAFNVWLQTVHALIYVLYMGIALNSASESLAGFCLCLVILNFMLKADKLVIKIFGLDKAGSLADVNQPDSYLKLLTKFKPMYSMYINITKTVQNEWFGKRGIGSELRYSLKKFDNYKDAEKYFENKKYNRMGNFQTFMDSPIKNTKLYISNTKLGKWVSGTEAGKFLEGIKPGEAIANSKFVKWAGGTKLGKAIVDGGKSIHSKARKMNYADQKKLLSKNISLDTKRKIYKSINNNKKLSRQRFTRPLGFAKDMIFIPAELMAGVALTIADPSEGIKTLKKAGKRISKHTTLSKAEKKKHVYKDTRAIQGKVYRKAKSDYEYALKLHVDEKFGFHADIERLSRAMKETKNPEYREKFKAQIEKHEQDRKKEIERLNIRLSKLEKKGATSTDPEIMELQKKYRKMYGAKSDMEFNADYKKAKEKYEESVNRYVDSQYDYETKIQEIKSTMSTATVTSEKEKFKKQIEKLEKEKAIDEAKKVQEMEEAHEKMIEELAMYRNSKHERNGVMKVLGGMLGASKVSEIVQSEIKASYKESQKLEKEKKRLAALEKMAKEEETLREKMGEMRRIGGYDFSDEEQAEKFDADVSKLITDARKTTVTAGLVKSVITSYMYDNKVKKINGENIDQVLDKLAEALDHRGSAIIISDELKEQVKTQLEEKMIKDKKGLGYNTKDAAVAIGEILGEEGVIKTTIPRSEVRENIGEQMKDKDRVGVDEIDSMLVDMEADFRVSLPDDVKSEIKHRLYKLSKEPENKDGLDEKTISSVINGAIKKHKVEDRSRYYSELGREEIDEMESRGIQINTEEYYKYLEDHGYDSKEISAEKVRNETRQLIRDMNSKNSNARVKLGGSLIDVTKVLKDARK